MKKPLRCIMLIDDSKHDNFFHKRVIISSKSAESVIAMESPNAALEYLSAGTEPQPDLIFLDLNMPGMNGWDFLTEYNKLAETLPKPLVVIMLTTSDNPDDRERALAFPDVSDFKTKPLTEVMLSEIFEKYAEASID